MTQLGSKLSYKVYTLDRPLLSFRRSFVPFLFFGDWFPSIDLIQWFNQQIPPYFHEFDNFESCFEDPISRLFMFSVLDKKWLLGSSRFSNDGTRRLSRGSYSSEGRISRYGSSSGGRLSRDSFSRGEECVTTMFRSYPTQEKNRWSSRFKNLSK